MAGNSRRRSDGAGYSGTPLARKLGVGRGARLALVDAPEGFLARLAPLPPEVEVLDRPRPPLDVVVLFVTAQTRLTHAFPSLAAALAPAGGLWVAWPKRSSGVTSDLRFEAVQAVGLSAGLVDNKVCAIDETWSALRFVVRRADRPRRQDPRVAPVALFGPLSSDGGCG